MSTPINRPESCKVVTSHGILCFNKAGNKVVLVTKIFTYAYRMAIHILNETQDINLAFTKARLDMMTCKEKLHIRNFIINNKSVNPSVKAVFEGLYNASTRDSSDIIEIPKGRSNNNEAYLYTAIREFTEETKIKEEDLKIVKFMNPYVYIIMDEGIIYISKIYIATYIKAGNIPIITAEDKSQLREVIKTKLYSANDIDAMIAESKIDDNYEKYVKDNYINYNYENLSFVKRIMDSYKMCAESIKNKKYETINKDTFNHLSRFNLYSNHSQKIFTYITDYKEKLAHRRRPKLFNNSASSGFYNSDNNRGRRSKSTNLSTNIIYENRPDSAQITLGGINKDISAYINVVDPISFNDETNLADSESKNSARTNRYINSDSSLIKYMSDDIR